MKNKTAELTAVSVRSQDIKFESFSKLNFFEFFLPAKDYKDAAQISKAYSCLEIVRATDAISDFHFLFIDSIDRKNYAIVDKFIYCYTI